MQDLLRKLEGFQWATALDLNMGCYHIELSPDSKKLYTIALPWGKYEYQKLQRDFATVLTSSKKLCLIYLENWNMSENI